MARKPIHMMEELLATARRLHAMRKLTVKSLKREHRRTSTDRLGAACRIVKAEARGARPKANAAQLPPSARRTAPRHSPEAPAPVPPRERRQGPVVRRRNHAPSAFLDKRSDDRDQRTGQLVSRDALLVALRGQELRSLSTGVQAMRVAFAMLLARVDALKARPAVELPLHAAHVISAPRALRVRVSQLLRRCAVAAAHQLRRVVVQ